MLMNNLDPDVAERPDDLVVYGGTGRAARSWEAFDAMVRTLRGLEADETMLVQSGKPVGVFRTHEWAPRVLIANSNLVPEWGTWEEFRRLEALGLTMYGQMTAGSWIYIGTQGILQGTYECFAEIARRRFGGTLAGTITLTAGLGGMGGAQPLAVTMNGGVALCIDVDPTRVHRRIETRYLDEVADSLADAVGGASRHATSVGPECRGRRQRGRRGPEAPRAGLPGRHRHRPDERPRPAVVRAGRSHPRSGRRAPPPRSGRADSPGAGIDGRPLRGDGRLPGRRCRGLRLRQQPPGRGRAGRVRPGVRLPRLPAGLHPAALLLAAASRRRPRALRFLQPTDGMVRGMPAEDLGGPITIPVGPARSAVS